MDIKTRVCRIESLIVYEYFLLERLCACVCNFGFVVNL